MVFKILFIDLDSKFTKWIKYYFKNVPGIECKTCKVQDYKPSDSERVAYVSPLNNSGAMDTGIDQDYNIFMFRNIRFTVRKKIMDLSAYLKKNNVQLPPEMQFRLPYLPVGSSIILPIEGTMHCLVGAPTLSYCSVYNDTPKNAYYAFKAILKVVFNYISFFGDNKIDTVVIPSLCCGSSKVDPKESAHQIFNAYFECLMGEDTDLPIYNKAMCYIYKSPEYLTYNKLVSINQEI